MIYADVETINRFERRGIEHGNDCVIGIRCGINHPQSVVVHVEVDDVVLGGVQIVGVVGRCEIELLHACVVWLINCHLSAIVRGRLLCPTRDFATKPHLPACQTLSRISQFSVHPSGSSRSSRCTRRVRCPAGRHQRRRMKHRPRIDFHLP